MMVSIDLVRQIYISKGWLHALCQVITYLTIELVNEGGPKDQVGHSYGNYENDEGGHPSVYNGLEFPIGCLLQGLHEGTEGVLDETELDNIELSEVGGVYQREGRQVAVLVVNINLEGLFKSLEVAHQN
jgi:hypothetical protein